MLELARKNEPLVFRVKPDESRYIRFIADTYGVSISEVIRELLGTSMTLKQMYDLAKGKHNSK